MFCGLASQYGFMPALAFAVAKAVGANEYTAIGIILTGASPGGTTSNLFTLWAKGDVPLSITMSFFSTLAAFFMLPLLIVIYIKALSKESIAIPWSNIIVSCLLIALPTALGLLVRRMNTTRKICGKYYWEWLRSATNACGCFFVLGALVVSIILNGKKLAGASWKLWIFALVMEPLGATFGYAAAMLCGLTPKDARTIALECGVQNFPFTITMITLTFGTGEEAEDALLFPLMYGYAYLVNSSWLVFFFRWLARDEVNVSSGDDDKGSELVLPFGHTGPRLVASGLTKEKFDALVREGRLGHDLESGPIVTSDAKDLMVNVGASSSSELAALGVPTCCQGSLSFFRYVTACCILTVVLPFAFILLADSSPLRVVAFVLLGIGILYVLFSLRATLWDGVLVMPSPPPLASSFSHGIDSHKVAKVEKLYVIVNPHGGLKKGLKALNEVVLPIWTNEFGIEVTVLETEYAGHARDYARKVDLEGYDGICIIGGDGSVHEVR